MSYIEYTGPGELHITDINEARTTPKGEFDRVITTCQESISDNIPDTIVYSFHNMSDGPTNEYGGYHSYYMFAQATNELYTALSAGETVLIHCHMGTSRSVSVAAAALGRLLNEPPIIALSIIHEQRPRNSYPDQLLMDYMKEYIQEYVDIDI